MIRQWYVLHDLQDRNETLYYKYLQENYNIIVSIVSNPTVAWVAKHFSLFYQRSRGMYFSA